MLASGTQVHGFESEQRIFQGEKNPQHAFLQRGSKAVCPMSQIYGMLKNPTVMWESPTVGKIDQSFLAHSSTFHYWRSLASFVRGERLVVKVVIYSRVVQSAKEGCSTCGGLAASPEQKKKNLFTLYQKAGSGTVVEALCYKP
jgi:hypothetical protein